MKKKISLFTISMASGGAERVISNLIPKLFENYEVTLFLMFNVFHYELPKNLRIIVVSKRKRLTYIQKLLLVPKVIFLYFNFVRNNKIDISMSFLSAPNLINGLLSCLIKNVKVIISERNFPSINYRETTLKYLTYRTLLPLFYNRADILFSNSEWINHDLKENFKINIPMEVIYNPIVLPEIIKDPTTFSQDKLRFINVGRIFAAKNQQMIIEAFETISQDSYCLTFLGEGIMKEQLVKQVRDKNLMDNFQFKGNVIDVNAQLIQHDCFILSSNTEGFPNALLEAMAIGLPVISTNCKSGPLELLNENEEVSIAIGSFVEVKYGILVNVNDHIGLNRAILHLLNNRDLFKLYGEKSKQRASAFELDIIYNRLKKHVID